MTRRTGQHHDWTPEERAARDAVRSLRTPEARAEFRAGLRDRFVSGDFQVEEVSPAEERVGAPIAGEPVRSMRGRNPSPVHRVRPWARYAAPVALAAVLAIMVGVFNQGPQWSVETAEGIYVDLDGERLSCDDLDPIQAALRAGCRIEVPEGSWMEVVSADHLLLQINGGVSMTLPRPPGRWFARDVASEFDGAGTLRVVTAPGFRGSSYRLRAGAAEVVVRGTAFSLMRGEGEICICVLEGEVVAVLPSGERTRVGPGGRLTFDEREQLVDLGSMLPTEREALLKLQNRSLGAGTSL